MISPTGPTCTVDVNGQFLVRERKRVWSAYGYRRRRIPSCQRGPHLSLREPEKGTQAGEVTRARPKHALLSSSAAATRNSITAGEIEEEAAPTLVRMGNTCIGPTFSRHSFFQSVSAAVPWRPRSSAAANDESPSAAPAPDRPPEPVTIFSDDVKSSGSPPPAEEYPPQSPPRHFKRLPSAGAVLPRKTDNLKDLYTLGRKLGQGQFGTTHLCVEKATGKQFACKSIAKRKLATYEDVEDVRREIQIMHHLSGHPNVISIIGTFEDAVAVHLVMDLCAGGELFDRIIQRGHFSEKAAAGLARVIVGVVEACHSMGVMHRDLKPENFLFVNRNEDSPLKAIDFGLSVFFKPGIHVPIWFLF
ncbi:hypothetical protein BHE74_00003403 [Ensete ventricosum]|nr:hypothetical protein BHE74_00003403 [Ensete ventricosum]